MRRPHGNVGVDGGMLLLLGALIQQQYHERIGVYQDNNQHQQIEHETTKVGTKKLVTTASVASASPTSSIRLATIEDIEDPPNQNQVGVHTTLV